MKIDAIKYISNIISGGLYALFVNIFSILENILGIVILLIYPQIMIIFFPINKYSKNRMLFDKLYSIYFENYKYAENPIIACVLMVYLTIVLHIVYGLIGYNVLGIKYMLEVKSTIVLLDILIGGLLTIFCLIFDNIFSTIHKINR